MKDVQFEQNNTSFDAGIEDNDASFNTQLEEDNITLDVEFEENDASLDVGLEETDASCEVEFDNVLVVQFGDVYEPTQGNAAQIGDTIYQTLGAALKAVQSGETIKLLNNVIYEAVIHFATDFCLDLNGYTLKSKGLSILAHGGSIVDNGATKGLLEVPKGFLVMSRAVYGMLPVWNEEGTGYVFVKVIDQKKPVEIISADSFAVECRPSISGGGVTTSRVFSDGALDNEITFKINIIGYDGSGNIMQSVALPPITDELVSSVYTNSTSFRYTINGMRYARCTVELAIETESGVVYRSEIGSMEQQ